MSLVSSTNKVIKYTYNRKAKCKNKESNYPKANKVSFNWR